MYRNGRTALGDIVIASKEDVVVPHPGGIVVNDDTEADIVVNAGSEGYDMMQTEFADIVVNGDPAEGYDIQQTEFAEISGGDDGLGRAQAQRLKRRVRGRRTKLGGATVVRVGYPDGLDNSLSGFSFKRMFKHPFGKKSLFGKVKKNIIPLAAGGLAFFGAKKVVSLLGKRRPAGTPVPAITSPAAPSIPEAPPTDATGATLPIDMARTVGTPSAPPSPVGGGASGSWTSQVASAAEAAGGGQETGDATVEQADVSGGGFGDMFKSPMGLVMLAAAAAALFYGMKGKGGRRRR